jgi:hypothetical protein
VQVYQGPTALLSPCLALPPQALRSTDVAIAVGDYASGFNKTGDIDVEFDDVTFDMK